MLKQTKNGRTDRIVESVPRGPRRPKKYWKFGVGAETLPTRLYHLPRRTPELKAPLLNQYILPPALKT